MKGTFGYDLNFLKQYHKDLVVLGDNEGAQVIIVPAYQGRVMTSTSGGNAGLSFGWVNHDLIASGKQSEHMNAFGGEDRFWLGPEGGQFQSFLKGLVLFWCLVLYQEITPSLLIWFHQHGRKQGLRKKSLKIIRETNLI
jgi:hypothetical protein